MPLATFSRLIPIRGLQWAMWPLAETLAVLPRDQAVSPLLNPIFCDAYLTREAQRRGAHLYAGGYLEDRRDIWRGSYLTPDASVHLGVDVQAPAGAPVTSPVTGTLHEAWTDPDAEGGWGGRAIIERVDGSLYIIAHLDLSPALTPDDPVSVGTPLGAVAPRERNGGWFPHVHLQVVRDRADLQGLDGYGPATATNAHRFPDPLGYS